MITKKNWRSTIPLLSLLIAFSLCSLSFSQEVQPPEDTETPEAQTKEVELRDPFCPIGWKPAVKTIIKTTTSSETNTNGEVEAVITTQQTQNIDDIAEWTEASQSIKIIGKIRKPKGGYIVTLKEKGAKEAGDTISHEYNGLLYIWKIKSITKKGMATERIGVRQIK